MEKWIQWKPIESLSGLYYFSGVSFLDNGLKLILSSEKTTQKVEVLFDKSIGSFRYIEELYFYKLISDLKKTYSDDFHRTWSFFKIEQSNYMLWRPNLRTECQNKSSITHFCFLGVDESIDIIANYEPKVTIIQK